jgi:hypothetical protein
MRVSKPARVGYYAAWWFTLLVAGAVIAVAWPVSSADKPSSSQPDPQALEQAIAEAASIDPSRLGDILETGRISPDSLPLTAVLFLLSTSSPQETEEFGFHTIVKLNAFLRSFARFPGSDPKHLLVSVVNPKYIRKMVCVLSNGHGRGELELSVDQVWHARLSFSCEFVHGRWRVTEFQLPVRQVRVVLKPDGSWKTVDPRGAVHTSMKGTPGASKTIDRYAGEGLEGT